MDFSLTEEQQDVADLARTIFDDKVSHDTLTALERGDGPRFDADLWKTLAASNLLGIGLPTEVGGSGVGLLAQSLVLEQIGRTLAPVPYLASIATAADVIAAFGTASQVDEWVRPAIDGERILTAAIAEPFNRDQRTPTTVALREGIGWRIDGVKTTVPAATIADGIVVTVSLPGEPSGATTAVFLVDPATNGVTITGQDTATHEPFARVEFDGAVVGADALLGGSTERGPEMIARLVERATVGLCAVQLGVTDAALHATAEYTKERVQFDRPIATFQAVGHRCADAYIDVEGIRLTLWQAIYTIESGGVSEGESAGDSGGDAAVDVQTAKFWASEGGHRIAHAVVHLHGGMGIATEYLIHRYFAFAKQIEFSLGGATEQAMRIGAQLAAAGSGRDAVTTTSSGLPLAGIRVVDTTDERGGMCARILADLGAEVIKVEPTGGSPARRLPPLGPDGTSYAWAVRNTNKLGVVIDLDQPGGLDRLHDLLAGADIWIDGHTPTELDALGIDPARVVDRHRHLIVVTITDFGLTGPYRNLVATDDVMVAISGMLARSGVVGRPPLLPPGSLASDVTSTSAAFVLAAVWQRTRTGHGQHLDVSVMQAVAQVTDWSMPNHSQVVASGGTYNQVRNGSGFVYSLYPCADGYVRLIILSPRQWRATRAWLGEPEILQDEHWDSLMARISIQTDILEPIFAEFFATRTAADLADEAQRRGIVMTPVVKPAEVTKLAHFVERETFAEVEATSGITGPVASGFFEIDGKRVGYRHRAPDVGEHDLAELLTAPRPAPEGDRPSASYPFAGLKVLDLGHGGVGVETGRLFAEYGADVIKVETHTYPDFIRQISGGMMSPSFASSSRSKRSVAINAKTPNGLATLKRMIEWADVMIENTSTGTMDDLGIPYEVVHAINPRLVMASSQLMGSTGPWKDWLGYGPSTRPAAGMTYLWNFDDGGMPPGSAAIHPDHLVGRTLAVGALAALIARESADAADPASGVGAHVEAAQVEALMNLLADSFLAEGVEPGSVGPEGNRSALGAPWGVYQCAGTERWCAITIRDDDDWRAFRTVLGDPEWAAADAFSTVDGRRAAHDEIDAHISAWTATREDREVMHLLQAAGVPAGYMAYPSDLSVDEHAVARDFPRPLEQPPIGRVMLDGPLFLSAAMCGPIVTPAPLLGEHTRDVCAEVLGMSAEEIDTLIAQGALEAPSP